jgi:hypothetical protein
LVPHISSADWTFKLPMSFKTFKGYCRV